MSGLETIRKLAPTCLTKEVEIVGEDGEKLTFTVKRLARIGDIDKIADRIAGRNKALKAKKGLLPVVIMPGDLEGFDPALFLDLEAVKDDKDGRQQFFLTSKSEVAIATTLEHGIVELSLWLQAAIFVRVAGMKAAELIRAFNEFNGFTLDEQGANEAEEDAKND